MHRKTCVEIQEDLEREMREDKPQAIYLKDYTEPDFLIDRVELDFTLDESQTLVRSRLHMRRNKNRENPQSVLILDGKDLELKAVWLGDTQLSADQYEVDEHSLSIPHLPDQFELDIYTLIKPQENTSLEGLYKSRTMFCTQCEAEGFRKITYFLDRPDVMAEYIVRITADAKRYPVLLSNGNCIAREQYDDGRHFTVWHDPFKKPSYLFALVAGDLSHIESNFKTMSGRDVYLRIYVEEKDLDKCDHAMDSLKRSMRWDEEVYGREYDLDIFNIVAVDDFNMGAMENKSLNIFNTSCVLANPATTTDAGFQRVEAVVAHEYFHNWSGNRVTCRDWFQLSLKEGFTVFRDAEFSADMGSRTVKRIEDVNLLRTAQFAEDSGPMAHPVRPESYMEISNFYTVTIYEKGAEVVRMLHQLLGAELFRKGTDLYFDRHDGQAATCEDFVRAMEDVSGRDLQQFRRWYSQAGTPVIQVTGHYDEDARTYSLTVKQSCPATPGQGEKLPFHIPLAMGLLGEAGALRLVLQDESLASDSADNTHRMLEITEQEQTFVFVDVPEQPVPSLFRGFSAPVRLQYAYTRDELMILMRKDEDGFVRWDAAQQLAVACIRDAIDAYQKGSVLKLDQRLIESYENVLTDESLDSAMVAMMLTLPSEAYLAEISDVVDVHAIYAAREFVRKAIGKQLAATFWRTYERLVTTESYEPNAQQIAARSLKNVCLSYLACTESHRARQACIDQFNAQHNMTDVLAALTLLVHSNWEEEKKQALDDFYQRWQHEALVVNMWFQVQASAPQADALKRVRSLMQHSAFDYKNPNKLRAVLGGFCSANAVNFHALNGSGYRFLADEIIALDKSNPQMASRLLTPLTRWRKYPEQAQKQMRMQLERIAAEKALSPDVFEVVSKSLG